MIAITDNYYFACDECPICENLEQRLRLAKLCNDYPQLDYCYCDKIMYKFWLGGYCEDAFVEVEEPRKQGRRKTGRAYRRYMKKKKHNDLAKLTNYGYQPTFGFDWKLVDGEWQQGQYLKFSSHSRTQKFFKRYSNKIVRRNKGNFSGNQYRKLFDYWWTLY